MTDSGSGMKARIVAAVVALTLGAAAAVFAQRDLSKVEVRADKLAEGVYVLFGAGGNMGLSVGPDGALLVDDQFAELSPKILATIKGVSERPVRFLVNTHWHGDHAGGNENMAKAGALIIAHDNVRRRLSEGMYNELFESKMDASPAVALPVITFNDSTTFHVNGD
ncbi:MAG: MBL fold metallo-hydrolase, partial [Candidatus Eisenbacteria bacterium]